MEVFIGRINERGNIVIQDHHLVRNLLLEKKGKELQIQIKEVDKKRSSSQNRWYWGIAIKTITNYLKEFEGVTYTPEDIHHYILNEVVKVRFSTKEVMGKTVTYLESKSTSAMSTIEFNDFKLDLQIFFDKKGIKIPDPVKNNYTNEHKPKNKD